MRCKPGDFAIVVSSRIRQNIGLIVEVVRAEMDLTSHHGSHTWEVIAQRCAINERGESVTRGFAKDCQLIPIGKIPVSDRVIDEVFA